MEGNITRTKTPSRKVGEAGQSKGSPSSWSTASSSCVLRSVGIKPLALYTSHIRIRRSSSASPSSPGSVTGSSAMEAAMRADVRGMPEDALAATGECWAWGIKS